MIALPDEPSIRRRHIVIPVDIPEVQVVHTAELRLHNLANHPPHAAVGQMIAAELRLRHTRRWCSPGQREQGDGPLEFSYEMHANPELWLVGGRRRGNFTAPEGETVTFPVMLLAQKAGHLLLPGLEIRTFVPTRADGGVGGGGGGAAVARRQIACEVDYRNHSETVLVLADLQTTTVSLSLSSAGGSSSSSSHGAAWLVDSERRGMSLRST